MQQGNDSQSNGRMAGKAYQHLAVHSLFSEAYPSEIKALSKRCSFVRVDNRERIVRAGDPCEGFYIVLYGQLKLFILTPRGVDKPLHILGAGDSFGDITMLLEKPYYLNATALEDCLLLYLPRAAILELIARNSQFALRMLASLSLRMRNVVDDIESFMLQPPAARVVTYLMRMLPEGPASSARIELRINKNVVAAQLNLTPETLSRYFRELADQNLVQIDGRTITVHDVDKLGDYLARYTGAAARPPEKT